MNFGKQEDKMEYNVAKEKDVDAHQRHCEALGDINGESAQFLALLLIGSMLNFSQDNKLYLEPKTYKIMIEMTKIDGINGQKDRNVTKNSEN